MVKGSIGLGLTVKAGKDNTSKNVTSDAYITVENPGDETMGAAQTCDIIVSSTETSATDIKNYLIAKGRGLDGIEALSVKYDEAKRVAVAGKKARRTAAARSRASAAATSSRSCRGAPPPRAAPPCTCSCRGAR